VKALKVNFVVRRPMGVWPWALVILMLSAFAALQGWRAWGDQARVRMLQREQVSLTQQLEAVVAVKRGAIERRNMLPAYAADAAAVAKLAAFPLDRVLSSLEAAQVQGVKVVSVETSASEATARVELEFTDHTALLNYLEVINAGEPTPRWVLLQAQINVVGGTENVGMIVSKWVVSK
jgi:hypothetical protein